MARTKCPKCGFTNAAEQTVCSSCRAALPRVSIQDDNPQSSIAVAEGGAQGVLFRRGQIIANRYTVIDLIGRGGMGCIYRVHDNTLDEEVALKTLLPQFVRDRVVVERFYNEARIARQLGHTNIVRVHDIGFAGNVLYISMEYLRGKSLRALMDELPPGQRLPIRMTLKIMDELCAALEYAHRFTVHRDIKPENVMLAADGTVKLMDFGISKLMTQNQLTAVSMVMGTPYYMSPEQLKDSRNVDARADIYSVGVMLYEMLTGTLPTGIIKPASQTLSDVPADLDPIVARCVEPDPRSRFATVHDLREALRPVRELIEGGAEVDAGPPVAVGPPPRGKKVVGMLLAAAILLAGGLSLWKLEGRRQTAAATPSKPAGTATAPDVPEFDTLKALVQEARPVAEKRAAEDTRLRRLVETGDSYWTQANTLRLQDEAQAVTAAWWTVQCLVGVLAPQPGMAFIPPGPVPSGDGSSVPVDGFFMDQGEVTNRDYEQFCRANDWRTPLYDPSLAPILSPPEVPVTTVAFSDALAYAAAAGKTLPTWAQWARATVSEDGKTYHDYPWGAEPESGAANVAGDSEGDDTYYGPSPPGELAKDTTAFGCFDTAGNVREWTRSAVPAAAGQTTQEVTPRTDPAALLAMSMLVYGGDYTRQQPSLKPVVVPALHRDHTLGFRCVREIPRTLAVVRQWLQRPVPEADAHSSGN